VVAKRRVKDGRAPFQRVAKRRVKDGRAPFIEGRKEEGKS
jgi:hypothetical protein